MIKIICNRQEVFPRVINFPDGTFKIDIDMPAENVTCRLIWKYENETELVQLMYIAKHLRQQGITNVELIMPYLPNARMDRVKDSSEVFTLKWFCEVINSLGFDKVEVLDVHSSVGEALLDRIAVKTPEAYIRQAMESARIDKDNDLVFFPDEGSCKRYSAFIPQYGNVGFGLKKRDWKTGKILGFDIHGGSPEGRNVFIIDDICSYGGTVYHAALKLKELGCKDIYAYFTHCENSIAKGE
ncbi:MAG: ribose-phosphate pyrophosphokinase-like domain-containing protein, partial [Ruminococcus sp.]|nr:ribose-phosphate pyrophosphokinase-like domain-containing protein [Ruminococcus sp.]